MAAAARSPRERWPVHREHRARRACPRRASVPAGASPRHPPDAVARRCAEPRVPGSSPSSFGRWASLPRVVHNRLAFHGRLRRCKPVCLIGAHGAIAHVRRRPPPPACAPMPNPIPPDSRAASCFSHSSACATRPSHTQPLRCHEGYVLAGSPPRRMRTLGDTIAYAERLLALTSWSQSRACSELLSRTLPGRGRLWPGLRLSATWGPERSWAPSLVHGAHRHLRSRGKPVTDTSWSSPATARPATDSQNTTAATVYPSLIRARARCVPPGAAPG